ncbi:hypothetical protein [Sporolactobacillus terrae]|uniref:hypothetical protein n=1 Tax=Sporolactobacillus terrae TaxID=269673 RepID=UPI000ACE5E29|nr:hypothetical protein [Sporolactobacillus terrae]
MEKWSNDSCLGYMLLAADRIGYDAEQKRQLLGAMYYEFDLKTVEEAAEFYRKR